MNKHQLKAQKIVQGAVGTFATAIVEVQKANELLAVAVTADETSLEQITAQIASLYERMDVVQADKINKNAEIIQNKELIARLEKFTR